MSTKRLLRSARSLLALALGVLIAGVAVAISMAAVRLAERPWNAVFGFAAAAAALSAAGILARWLGNRVPPGVLLELELAEPVRDRDGASAVRQLAGHRAPGLRELVETLERAAEDSRVVGLVAHIGRPATGFADAQELRDAVLAFRAAGKPAVAYADSFGEFTGGDLAYYVATAFDEVAVQPSGDVGLTGVSWEYTFFRDALDKLGVEARFDRRHEYKNAMDVFTQRGFTPAHREATVALAESQLRQLAEGISDGRGMSTDDARRLIDRGPFTASEALDAGLIDRVAYRDEALTRARERAGGDPALLYVDRYRKRTAKRVRGASAVALISGTGAITRGRSRFHPLTGRGMGADAVAAAFRAAVADPKVHAILFRIDSPGGSYVGSDTVWREVVRAREAGKPVVASMGNVAASGGYFVAMAADRIVAHAGTLTGSIGVVAGKPVIAGLRARIGAPAEAVDAGEHAGMMSSSRDYRPAEWDTLQRWLDRVYDDFTSKVAAGRGLSAEQVADAARGRVWTGADAAERGLVDELGGYRAALDAVRAAAGLEADAPVRLVPYPKKRPVLTRLRREAPESSEDLEAALEAGASTALWAGAPAALAEIGVLHAQVAAAARRAGLPGGAVAARNLPDWT